MASVGRIAIFDREAHEMKACFKGLLSWVGVVSIARSTGISDMKAAVTKNGVIIPRRFLKKGVKQVEIRKEAGRIVVLPLPAPDEPIFRLGKHPVKTGIANASTRHDEYLYSGK